LKIRWWLFGEEVTLNDLIQVSSNNWVKDSWWKMEISAAYVMVYKSFLTSPFPEFTQKKPQHKALRFSQIETMD